MYNISNINIDNMSSENLLSVFITAMKDYAIFVIDTKGFVKSWNEGAKNLKLYEASEIIGKHFSIFYTQNDIERNHPENVISQAKNVGRYEEEGIRVKKDGTFFWANIVINAVFDDQKNLIGFTKVIRNLTDKKNKEDKLKDSYHDIERKILFRTQEITHAKESAEKSLRAKDNLLAITSHELKTPLTSLKLKAQVLKYKLNSQSPNPDLLNYFEESDRQINRMARIVDDMLDLTMISQGRLSMFFQETDICFLINRIIESAKLEGKAKNLSINYLGLQNYKISLDPVRIEQVFTNLISNAIKYAPGSPIHISCLKDDNFLVIKFLDEGPGISNENLEKIFTLYERLDNKKEKGMGVGLYLTKMIIESHGGTISVETKMNMGTSFTIKLPINLAKSSI